MKLHKHSVVRVLTIDAGHRIVGHENKCQHLHGHTYKFEIYATNSELDSLGRVIDFGCIKRVLGEWLDWNWDHGMILWRKDEEVISMLQILKMKMFLLPNNPTAENLASYLLMIANDQLKSRGVEVTKVVCWETQSCRATAEL